MRKKRFLFLLPLMVSLTGCTVDLSSDDFTSKLIPNWVSFVTQVGALVVLVTVVLIFGYKPIKKIVTKRQDYIEQNIRDAEEAKATWQENERQSEATVLASNRTAAHIVAEAKETALKEKSKILEETALEVEKMKLEAENDIARMELEAQEEIRKEMVDIALEASKELLGREVSSKDNTRLIEEFIDEVKKENKD